MADTHYNLTHQNGNVAQVEKATWRQTQRPSLYLLWARRQTLHQFGQQQSILFLPLALSIGLHSLNFEKTRLYMTMQLKCSSRTYIPDILIIAFNLCSEMHIQSHKMMAGCVSHETVPWPTSFFLPFPPSFAKWNKDSRWVWPSLYLSACKGPGLNPNSVSQFHMQTHCYSF